MHKPALYVKESVVAQESADYVLHKNFQMLQAEGIYTVLDVGCGPGNVTHDKLVPILPKTTKKIIGIDVSPEHVEYAKENYQIDTRVSYQQMDIQTDVIPDEFVSEFDLITSFYCLHFVKNQKKALTNIYTMLKPGGSILISFLRKNPLTEIYREMFSNPKWAECMRNIDEVVSVENSVSHYVDLFKEAGFGHCRYEDYNNFCTFSKQRLFGILSSINLFKIPKNLENEFIEDQIEVCHRNKYSTTEEQENFNFPYTDLIISATKN